MEQISLEITEELTNYLQKYTTQTQTSEKQRQAATLGLSVSEIRARDNTAKRWIQFILTSGKLADDIQLEAPKHTNFTDASYMVIHRTRRQLDQTKVQDALDISKKTLAAAEQQYIRIKKKNQPLEALRKFEKEDLNPQVRQLVHLGFVKHLFSDYSIEDVREIIYPWSTKLPTIAAQAIHASRSFLSSIPGVSQLISTTKDELGFLYGDDMKNVADINPHLPIVAQHGDEKLTYEKYYIKRNHNGVRPEGKPQDTPLQVSTLTPVQLDHVLPQSSVLVTPRSTPSPLASPTETKPDLPETFSENCVAELDYELKKCLSISPDVESVKQLYDYISEELKYPLSAEQALNLVIKIGNKADEVQKSTYNYSKRAEALYYILHKLRNTIKQNAPNAYQARLQQENDLLLQKKEELCALKLKATLEDPQLEAIQVKEDEIIKHRIKMAHLDDLDPLLSLRQYKIDRLFSGISRNKYRWRAESDGEGCIYLPVVFWRNFPRIFEMTYEAQLKAVMVAEELNASLTHVEEKIKKLSKTQNLNADSAVIKTDIENIKNLIPNAIEHKKEELINRLTIQQNDFTQLKNTLEQTKLENDRLKKEEEKTADEKLTTSINESCQLIASLTKRYHKLLHTSEMELKANITEHVEYLEATGVRTEVEGFQKTLSAMQSVLANKVIDAALSEKLTDAIEQLNNLEKAISTIEKISQNSSETLELVINDNHYPSDNFNENSPASKPASPEHKGMPRSSSTNDVIIGLALPKQSMGKSEKSSAPKNPAGEFTEVVSRRKHKANQKKELRVNIPDSNHDHQDTPRVTGISPR